MQGILLSRFDWLVKKDDFASFGINFKVYVACVMGISFVTMVHALLTYHNRSRRSLRKIFSLHTASLVSFWTILLVIKVGVYVLGFMNNPGLFWVPMFVKMCLLWLILACCTCFEHFQALPVHDKFVYIVASSLVPVSIPSKDTKNTKGLYALSITLFLFECLFVVLFAFLIRHFYHFNPYKEFYADILPQKLNMGSFDDIFVFTVLLVLAVTLVATLLLYVSIKCCHPKSNLFDSEKPEPESTNVSTEDNEEEMREEAL